MEDDSSEKKVDLHLGPHAPKPSKANIKGLMIAFIYGLSSASMAFANKAILTGYKYDYPIFIVITQMLVSIVGLELLRLTGRITLPAFTIERGWSFFLPSVFYTLNSVLALWALSGMNIPMYGVMKRCAPMVIMLLGPLILKKGPPSARTATAVGFITLGCIVAGYGDRGFDAEDYIICGISVISQSLYLVLVQKSSQTYTATETLHLNCYNTLPLLLVTAVIFGELSQGMQNFHYLDVGFIIMFAFVVGMGCMLNYLLFLCTIYNSALTTSITGTLKTVVQTAIGIFTFGGISINRYTTSGIAMNLSGGILYVFAKYAESKHKLKGKSGSGEISTQQTTSDLEKVENGNIANRHITEPSQESVK